MTTPSRLRSEFLNACRVYRQAKRKWERDTKHMPNFKSMMDALELKRKARKKCEDQNINTDELEQALCADR